MSATQQPETAIVVEGWTWGLDEVHSQAAAFRAKDLNTVCKMADELLTKEITDDGELISCLIENKVLPFDRANQLAKYAQKFWKPGCYLCARKDAPPEALDEWAEAGDLSWIRTIVGNQNTKLETIEKLARHSDPEVAYEALCSGRLPQETIDRFASDNEPKIQSAVAGTTQNPEILRTLAKSDARSVLSSICHNKHTPTAVINEIGRRHLDLIATQPYRVTDPAVLRSLCDKYGKQYEVYLANKDLPDEAQWRKHWPLVVNGHCWGLNELESLAAAREVKDKELITRMADDFLGGRLDINNYPVHGDLILDYLTANEALPIEIAKQLSRLTTDWGCRNRVVSRSDVTPDILDEFADQPGQYVVNNIVHNDKVKPETVARIALNGELHEVEVALSSSRLPDETLECFVASEVQDFRETVAFHSKKPETIAKLAFDPVPCVRAAAVGRDILDVAVLEQVATTDNNIDVVIRATKRLTNPDVLKAVYDQLGKWPACAQVQQLKDALIANPHTSELVRVVIQI